MTEYKQQPAGPQALPMNSEEWCVYLHTHQVSDRDRELHEAWLGSRPGNRAEYALCELSWKLSQGLANSPSLAVSLSADGQTANRSVKHNRWKPLAVAASVLLCAFVAMMTVQWLPADSFQTAIGEFRQVGLNDGSTIDLNTDTAIDVDLSRGGRIVELHRGEAFFDVAPDPNRPFVVRTATGEVTVLGTKFNVSINNGETLVTVLEGHVQVAAAPDAINQQGSSTAEGAGCAAW